MGFSKRFQVNIVLSLLLAFTLCLTLFVSIGGAHLALASSPSIMLSQTSGPPTSMVTVSGSGFGISEGITLYFDTTQVGTATTNHTGTFSQKITVPGSALPGNHTVQAIGQKSGLSAKAPFLVQANWPMFGFFASHNLFNPYENVVNVNNASGLILDWKYGLGSTSNSAPAVYHGIVYVSTGSSLNALDATTGMLKWSYPAGDDSPAVANNVVYIGTGDTLDALDATVGTLLWSYSITKGSGITDSPTIINGVVYIGSGDGKLYALDATAGTLKWSFDTGGGVRASLFSSPAVANGIVYFGTWESYDKLYALDAATGVLKWSYTTGSYINSSPAIANGFVYFLSEDHRFYALDAVTGVLKWKYLTSKAPGSLDYSSPAVANGVVYIGAGQKLDALNATTGKLLWSYTTGQQIFASPATANGVVYIGSLDHNFYALNATTGALLWTYTTGAGIYQGSAAVANGIIYVISADNHLYAFHLPGMNLSKAFGFAGYQKRGVMKHNSGASSHLLFHDFARTLPHHSLLCHYPSWLDTAIFMVIA